MQIFSIQNTNFPKISFGSKPPARTPSNLNGLTQPTKDIFEKNIQNIKQTKQVNKPKNYDELFEETYKEFLKQNPMFEELQIPKPKLGYSVDRSTSEAQYDFGENKIYINKERLDEDTYIVVIKNYENQDMPMDVVPKSGLETIRKIYEKELPKGSYIEYIKLTQEEKELWQKSCIAHELRHCLQNHLTASLKNNQSKTLVVIKELLQAEEELLRRIEKEQGKNSEAYKQEYTKYQNNKEKYSYGLNFTPHKIIDDNTTLPYSFMPDLYPEHANKKWSVKEHFERADKEYDNSDPYIYISSPLEIDAYYYQKEFIMNAARKNSEKYRDEFIIPSLLMCADIFNRGLSVLEKNSYPPLEQTN